jgi:hypothetical protein
MQPLKKTVTVSQSRSEISFPKRYTHKQLLNFKSWPFMRMRPFLLSFYIHMAHPFSGWSPFGTHSHQCIDPDTRVFTTFEKVRDELLARAFSHTFDCQMSPKVKQRWDQQLLLTIVPKFTYLTGQKCLSFCKKYLNWNMDFHRLTCEVVWLVNDLPKKIAKIFQALRLTCKGVYLVNDLSHKIPKLPKDLKQNVN